MPLRYVGAMARKKSEFSSFEDSLAELEALVERMESGELSLDESIQAFERGTTLTQQCQQALAAAEQRVEILSAKSVDAKTEPFDEPD